MQHQVFRMLPGAAFHALLCAGLLVAAVDAEAKGRRGGGSSSSRSSSSHHDAPESGSGGTTIHLRSSSSSNNASPSSGGASSGNAFIPVPRVGRAGVAPTDAAAAPLTPEEEARRAVLLQQYEKEQRDYQATLKAAAEKQEADRQASQRAAEARASQKLSEENAVVARAAAEQDRKKRHEATLASEADQVLQRAIADYPVLKTPEGQHLLQSIMDRQKVLQARGVYPSMAMVEAVADHKYGLSVRTSAAARPVSLAVPVEAAAPAEPEKSRAIGECRWVTATQWSCK